MSATPALAAPSRSPLILHGPGGRRPRLLLAEDCDPIRIVTAAMLKGMGCDVDAVVHGEDALKLATDRSFDVIVLDIEMPVMDGITAARSIRKLGGGRPRTPIMALSAFMADAMQSGHLSDAFDIALPKPANRNELHAAVKAALDFHAAKASDDEPLIAQSQRDTLRRSLRVAVWAGLAEIACRDIAASTARLDDIVSGRMAGSLSMAAQKLQALGRTFAAPRLAVLASKLENLRDARDQAGLMARLSETADATVAELRRT